MGLHPSKFQRVSRLAFVTAATSLTVGQPNFARCLAVSRAGTLHTFRGCSPCLNFARCKIHFTPKSCILLYWQPYCTALQQRASAKLCDMVQGILECGPMPNAMAVLPNIGGALCESSIIPFLVPRHKVWLTPAAGVLCSKAANIVECKTWA